MKKKLRSVDPLVYTEDYYLSDCMGFEEFKRSYGEDLEVRLQEVARYLNILPAICVLDIGCGRGELVYYAAKNGAQAVGIDYSKEAIRLANLMKSTKRNNIQNRMNFFVMDAKKLVFKNAFFDLIILTDVVEHLYAEELDVVFQEIKRVLKKDGRIIIHTAPNKLFFDFTYRFYSYPVSNVLVKVWNIFTRSKYPNIASPDNLRTDSHAIMHVNEPSYFSLRKLFDKYGFKGSILSTNIPSKKNIASFKDILFNFIVFLHPLSKFPPFNFFFGSDFIVVLSNKT